MNPSFGRFRQGLALTLAALLLSNSAALAAGQASTACAATDALARPARPSAGTLTVLQICRNSRSVSSATVNVAGENGASAPAAVSTGQNFPTPVTFSTPADVTLDLYSANGNLQRIGGATTILQIVGKFGEVFNLAAGQLGAFVNNRLNFYTVQALNVTAASRGTIFTVDAKPNVSVTFSITEGKLALTRLVAIKLDAENRTIDGIRVTDTITPTGIATITYAIPFPLFKEFKSVDDARSYFLKALSDAETAGDEFGVDNALQNIQRINGIIPPIGADLRPPATGPAAAPAGGLSGTTIGLIAIAVVGGAIALGGGKGSSGAPSTSGNLTAAAPNQSGTVTLQNRVRIRFAFAVPIRL